MPTNDRAGLNDGDLFAGYKILRRLGAGGMGEVYLAQHPRLPRRDALKILPSELTSNLEFRQRFNREADLAGSLYNEHIVGIHDRGEFHGQLWLSMDYVEGTDAAALLHHQYPSGMPLADVVEIIAAVADALDYAHSRGLLHRDIKPANILLGDPNPRRRILLADFGIARQQDEVSGLTATGMLMGTAAYCAPEQLQGSDLDGRVDQYALGCTAFQLLTGGAPFHDPNPAVVISQHLSTPPPLLSAQRPELAHLDWVIGRALAKDRAARFASCADFAAALGAPPGAYPQAPTMAVNMPTQVIAPPPPARSGGHTTLIASLAAVGLVVVALVLGIVVIRNHSAGHATRASQQGTGTQSQPPAPVPAGPTLSTPALQLTSSVTDATQVLGPLEHAEVERALRRLLDLRGTHLWVVYVADFGGLKPAKWVENTIRANNLSDNDAMLAVATGTDRATFSFYVPAAITNGRPIDVEQIRRERIKPDVERHEWTRAALAAANGLEA